MKERPLVSIIMPIYNCGRYLSTSIKSILAQDYENWELLIGDDCSTDNTLEIARRFNDSRIRIFQNKRNIGPFANKNALLKHSAGSYITFQDGDDYSAPERLRLQVEELESNAELGAVGSQMVLVNKKGATLHVIPKPTTYEELLDKMYDSNVLGSSMMMIRHKILDDIGGLFREYFGRLSYQDYDLSLRIAQKFQCYCLPQFLYFYRQHKRSISKEISIDRYINREVVINLAKQRKDKGMDYLMQGMPEKVDDLFLRLKEPYYENPSLIYREYAATYMFNRLYISAIGAAVKGIVNEPFDIKNLRTLIYCIRKAAISWWNI